ncbi:TetR family transcriptional regulator [Mycobacterium sp. 1245801.1]|uniref:TetR family transcriptional regulator n=1 Tax=Mycobacterium sp. 1245801.1 TaxID=1834075 RepID=UPI0009F74146|nr:TetR family transcriptional regulator [Mycobacterium sp. 1245801.1]
MVAARSGVSKATMYRRWPSKARLVVEAVESLREHPCGEYEAMRRGKRAGGRRHCAPLSCEARAPDR